MARKGSAGVKVAVAGGVIAGLVHLAHGGVIPATLDALTGGQMPANEQLANHMAAAMGWGHRQQQCLDALWTRESAGTWSPTVVNPTSGAYGIPQSLPAGKMAAAGSDWRTNPRTQITWGFGYIRSTYTDPCGAWGHETANNWY